MLTTVSWEQEEHDLLDFDAAWVDADGGSTGSRRLGSSTGSTAMARLLSDLGFPARQSKRRGGDAGLRSRRR